MAGALVHIAVGVACAVIVYFLHFKLEFSSSIFIGNLLPDAIRNCITAVYVGTISIARMRKTQLYTQLAAVTGSFNTWLIIGLFIAGVTFLLYYFHAIKKKTMNEYDELYIFLLIGIIIHLVLDILWNENTIWY